MNKDIFCDIVVPIYNGFDFLENLFDSLFKEQNFSFRLILINDASTDERIKPFLVSIKERFKEVEILIIENEKNQGFVKSINLGLRIVNKNFVILNSDTEVPEGWLSRIFYPILKNKNIATVTPMTNSGTICSFPKSLENNDILENLSVSGVDFYFKKIDKNILFETPTGVGFCMAFNFDVFKNVGFFDEENFGKGYGEENDWCQRAVLLGYLNVITPNLFVYHKHGGSFPSKEKEMLIKKNLEILNKKHPNYKRDVSVFIEKDPIKEIRDILFLLITSNNGVLPIVYFDHELGGGANLYTKNMIEDGLSLGKKYIVISFNHKKNIFNLRYYCDKSVLKYSFKELKTLLSLLSLLKISKIIVGELVSYPNIKNILNFILEIKNTKKIETVFLVHDYFCITPYVVLLDDNKTIYDLKIEKDFEKFIRKEYSYFYRRYKMKEQEWKSVWGQFLCQMEQIVCFSESSRKIMIKNFDKISEKIIVKPHKVKNIFFNNYKNVKKKKTNIVIGVLGGINYVKGSGVIDNLLLLKKDFLKVVVIGDFVGNTIPNENFTVTGSYKVEDLPKLVEDHKIDIFFVPSVCAETFSYTTEEIINTGLPVAVFDIGAPSERVSLYKKGLILKSMEPEYIVSSILKFLNNLPLD